MKTLCHRIFFSSDFFNWDWPKNDTGSVSAGELSLKQKMKLTKIKWNKSDICFDAMFNLCFGLIPFKSVCWPAQHTEHEDIQTAKHDDKTNEND